MKKELLILYLALFLIKFNIYAQEEPCVVNKHITINSPFFFNSFQEGIVVFSDTLKIRALLNYNIITDNIYYSYDNDLYSLDTRDIKYVAICNYRFYFRNTFVLQLLYNKDIKLFVSRKINQEELHDKKGAYNAKSPNTVGSDYAYIKTRGGVKNLRKSNNDKELSINCYYKIMKNNKLYPANKKTFLKLYQNKKPEILEYIRENNIRFNNEASLKQLANFCENL